MIFCNFFCHPILKPEVVKDEVSPTAEHAIKVGVSELQCVWA